MCHQNFDPSTQFLVFRRGERGKGSEMREVVCYGAHKRMDEDTHPELKKILEAVFWEEEFRVKSFRGEREGIQTRKSGFNGIRWAAHFNKQEGATRRTESDTLVKHFIKEMRGTLRTAMRSVTGARANDKGDQVRVALAGTFNVRLRRPRQGRSGHGLSSARHGKRVVENPFLGGTGGDTVRARTKSMVVTEEIVAKPMEEVPVVKNFADLPFLGAGTNAVEERVGLRGRISRRLDGRSRVVGMDNHCVLKEGNRTENTLTAGNVLIALVSAQNHELLGHGEHHRPKSGNIVLGGIRRITLDADLRGPN